jgi:methyltransferase (TIGR00027 family)
MKRIETTTSRTAEWTCLARAVSSLEANSHYRSDDHIARLLLPGFVKPLLHTPFLRTLYKAMVPKGLYNYVIARTKYVDAIFRRALAEQFDQILIFGAGFDTRALRFQHELRNSRIFELDVPTTQKAKIAQYLKRNLAMPSNLIFIAIDFDKESLPAKLGDAGFRKGQRSLFVLEGLLMYLQPDSVDATFRAIQEQAGERSWVVFDCVYASVLRKEKLCYGESGIMKSVTRAGERWYFAIERGQLEQFLSTYGLKPIDEKSAQDLEKAYFSEPSGRIVGRVNGAHCLVTAERNGN